MTAFQGFPQGTKSLPVPSPLLGSLLEEIDDIAELKCTLRFLWHAAQVKGAPKAVPAATLAADGVLIAAIGSPDAVRDALAAATARGTLIKAGGALLLRTPENERAAARMAGPGRAVDAVEPRGREERPNVYELYEANVGLLTPMVADRLRDAEAEYPAEWIEAAIRGAVERNVRSWRYIAAILERWASEGRGAGEPRGTGKHGESGRHPKTASAAEYLRQRRAAG